MPIDPSFAVGGAEWSVGGLAGSRGPAGAGAAGEAAGTSGEGFGDLLAQQIEGLSRTQVEAAEASQQLAAGTATDITAVVTAVERARLSMELASQIRTKAVEAYRDVFHTQV